MNKNIRILIIGLFVILGMATASFANPDHLKIYRKVYPNVKMGCIYCHTDEKPKKEDGKHDLNAYGEKAKEAGEKPSEDVYRNLGPHDQFKE